MEEIQLLKLAQTGDESAFQALLEINFIKSKAIIQKQYGLSFHDLQDIMQTTSLFVWKHLKQCKENTAFYNWFYSVFKSKTVDFLRQRNEIEEHELGNVAFDAEELEENPNKIYINSLHAILNDTARTFIERKEAITEYKTMIFKMMLALKEHHREIINLILIEEKSYKEVSKILDIPLGSVMSRLYYAKIEAKKIIKEYARNNNVELVTLG